MALSKQSTFDEKPKKKDRRFSKTFSIPVGKNPFTATENLKMNRIERISNEVASGNQSSLVDHSPKNFG